MMMFLVGVGVFSGVVFLVIVILSFVGVGFFSLM